MGVIRKVKLTSEQRKELETGYRTSNNATFSRRCHIILLKSESRTSKEVADIMGTNQISVNQWLDRYEAEGIDGLRTRSGRGRKPVLDVERDERAVRKAVKQERQQLKKAKENLERNLGKTFSLKTLQRFLKNLSADGDAFD